MRNKKAPTPDFKTIQTLHRGALKAMKNAHAPYSKYQVGAAILTEKGKLFTGCNVENASYGATICAEQAAICSFVSGISGGKDRIKAIGVITNSRPAAAPCGICRQILSEFGSKETPVFLFSTQDPMPSQGNIGKLQILTLSELLPHSFNSSFLT